MKKNSGDFNNLINIIFFMLAIFIIAILNLFSPKDNTISVVENRNLMVKPVFTMEGLFSGKYLRDFENYFADNFISRENLVKINMGINKLKGITLDEDAIIVEHEGANIGGNTGNTEDEVKTKGNLLILNDTVMEIYKFNEKNSMIYADMLNSVQETLGDKVQVFSLLAPIQIEFLEKQKYKNLSDSQKKGIDFVNSNLKDKVIPVDAYNPINEHKDEYVYFRSDHHWTALGAYYAYTGFAKSAKFDPIPLNEYVSKEAPGYLGQLSTIQSSDKVNNNPDTVVYYMPYTKSDMTVYFYDPKTGEEKTYQGSAITESYANGEQKYGVFLGGDFPMGVIKTNAGTDKKIAVIKDSYANAFIPFLLPHYSEIYVIDPRHYKDSIKELVEKNEIDEVLFLNYILTTNFTNYVDSVLKLME